MVLVITDMLIDMVVHRCGRVEHYPFEYVGAKIDLVREYDMDYFSVWEVKELVKDLGYINNWGTY
jgi:hypothetical protein